MSDAGRPAPADAQAFMQPVAQAHRSPVKRRRGVGIAVSVAAHLAVALAVLWAAPKPQAIYDPRPVVVQLVDETPAPAPALLRGPTSPLPPAPEPPAPSKPTPKKAVARKAPPKPAALPRHLVAAPSAEAAASDSGAELSGAELAGAAMASSGGGGGGGSGGACNMAGRVQAALRKDPLAENAIARFAGKAVRVWDGDWVWIPGDDGRGVAAVRQAMMWEIAFAPAACRAERMHGLVLLSANSARLAVGAGEWRWADLLTPHPGMGGSHYTQ